MQKNWWVWLTLPAAATTAILVAVAVLTGEHETAPSRATATKQQEAGERAAGTRTATRQPPAVARTRNRARENTTTSRAATAPTRTTTTTEERPTGTAQVPHLYGLSPDQAVVELEEAGFRAKVRRERSFQPDGLVFEQAPRSGRRLPQGKTVLVTVSVFKSRAPAPRHPPAPPVSAVPPVVGLDYWEAAARMEILGVVANLYPVRSPRPFNVVVAQVPAAGVRVRRGSRVRLTVSWGNGPLPAFMVPDTVGLTELFAHARCRDFSFTCRTVLVSAREPREAGRVVRQQPPAGSTARAMTQMTLYVGR
jgi:beta-lactam-binding protein with PASTA domain